MYFLNSYDFNWTHNIDISENFAQGSDFVTQDCDDDMLDDFFFTEADLKVLLSDMCLNFYLYLYFSPTGRPNMSLCLFHFFFSEGIKLPHHVPLFVN